VRTALLAVSILAASLVAEPARAVEPITADGTLLAGMYSSVWNSGTDLTALGEWSGKRASLAGSFHSPWENNPADTFSNTQWILEQAWLAKATPFANLGFPGITAAAVARGDHDQAIRHWAGHVKAWLDRGGGRSMFIAPLQEMNGNWVSYGMDGTNFKSAYRRIISIFRELGLSETKVRWVFAPNGWSTPPYKIADYYPGDDVVDAIGISAYNFGSGLDRWASVYEVFHAGLEELRTTVTASKPYFIAQTGSPTVGGERDPWLIDMFRFLAEDPNVVGFVYFNIDVTATEGVNFQIWNGSSGEAGWREGMGLASTRYQWPLTNWFQPGPLPFQGPAAAPGPCPEGKECDRIAAIDAGSRFSLYQQVAEGSSVDGYFYGQPGDLPLMGDWDGDGVKTPGMYRASNGFVYIRNSNTQGAADREFFFGQTGDIPVVGDWNGDGKDTISIYRNGTVYVTNQLGTVVAEKSYLFGVLGDRPFAGDFNGDGKDTVGLYRESSGFVYFRNTLASGVAEFDFFYGEPGDRILAGDWDGNGSDTVAVFRPRTGTVYFNLANVQSPATHSLRVGSGTVSVVAA